MQPWVGPPQGLVGGGPTQGRMNAWSPTLKELHHHKKPCPSWPPDRAPSSVAGLRRVARSLGRSTSTLDTIPDRVAQVQNVAQVALEAGNSAKMIFSNYRELVKPAQAAKWFAITPEQPANIIQVPTATSAPVEVAEATA